MLAIHQLENLRLNPANVPLRRNNNGWRPPVPPRRRWWRSQPKPTTPAAAAAAAAAAGPTGPDPGLQLQSPLFRLPAELRRVVYAHYLAREPLGARPVTGTALPTTPAFFEVPNTAAAAAAARACPPPALARTCRRLRAEVAAEAGGVAALHLGWRGLALRAAAASHSGGGGVRWAGVRTLHLVVDMGLPRFHAWAGLVHPLLAGGEWCPGLRELVVHWRPRAAAWQAVGGSDEVRALRRAREMAFLAALAGAAGLRRVVLVGHGPEGKGEGVPEWWEGALVEMGVRSVVRLHGDCTSWEGQHLGFCSGALGHGK